MNLYLRLLIVLIKNLLRKRFVHFREEVITSFRVLPNDLDLNFHMNNGRYLTIMDLGRLDYLGKVGMLKPALKRKWMPILGAAQISFLRPLDPLQTYTLHTQLDHWDHKWFVITQRFEAKGKVCAQARVRGILRGPKGNIAPAEAIRAAGYAEAEVESPLPSEITNIWLQSLDIKQNHK